MQAAETEPFGKRGIDGLGIRSGAQDTSRLIEQVRIKHQIGAFHVFRVHPRDEKFLALRAGGLYP